MGYSLKDIKGITIAKAFQNILDESNHKPNKIWVDKGSESYNRSIKNNFCRIMIQTCRQRTMKENPFLLKNSLEP